MWRIDAQSFLARGKLGTDTYRRRICIVSFLVDAGVSKNRLGNTWEIRLHGNTSERSTGTKLREPEVPRNCNRLRYVRGLSVKKKDINGKTIKTRFTGWKKPGEMSKFRRIASSLCFSIDDPSKPRVFRGKCPPSMIASVTREPREFQKCRWHASNVIPCRGKKIRLLTNASSLFRLPGFFVFRP